ncbi:MAG: hypothetical protein NVSMB51_12660 [Solirubrobacteraceae bacterium]
MKLLAIYLNDHYAGSTLGLELARRAADANPQNKFLRELAGEIEEDREALRAVMDRLEIPVNRVKVAGAWATEKLGRLKLNGRLTTPSPLSRLVELEGLTLGVRGKLALWEALARVPDAAAAADLPALQERARRQYERLDELRLATAGEVLLSS